MKILVTPTSLKPDSDNPALEQLRSFAGELVFNTLGRPLTADELVPLLDGCTGCVAGLDAFTAKTLENASGLKIISRYGAGVDNVDLATAKARGIVVCNTPGVNAQAVADLTMALLICLARKVHILDRKMRQGQWTRSTGVELYYKTIAVLGLGMVGKSVAKRAAGFSMNIIAYDPFMDAEYAKANGITVSTFEECVQKADFLCLHLPLTEKTRHLISGSVMRSMKPGAIIVNTARGGLIDETAAYELLKSGHLGGLGLDVYEEEPPKIDLFSGLENVVLTPHTAAHTAEATAAMAALAVQNLIDVLSGRDCPYIVR
jgi:D-3-phosphoglycerate dehydrogenase